VRPIGQHQHNDDPGDLFEIRITAGAFQGMRLSIRRDELEEMQNTPPTPEKIYQRSS
jgi:stress-induced morphogen